jgi:hypothetical protein
MVILLGTKTAEDTRQIGYLEAIATVALIVACLSLFVANLANQKLMKTYP